MYVIFSQQKKLSEHSEYICVTFTMLLSRGKNTVFLAHDPGSLHLQSVINKRCEYKYEVIAILKISAITSNDNVEFDQIMVRHSANRVFIVCRVTGVSAVWHFHNRPVTLCGWGSPLRGDIVICLARALWALETRQHVNGLVWYHNRK